VIEKGGKILKIIRKISTFLTHKYPCGFNCKYNPYCNRKCNPYYNCEEKKNIIDYYNPNCHFFLKVISIDESNCVF
jgi:hypothetical protein